MGEGVLGALEIALAVASVCILVLGGISMAASRFRDSNAWSAGFSPAVVAGFLAGFPSYGHDNEYSLVAHLADCRMYSATLSSKAQDRPWE